MVGERAFIQQQLTPQRSQILAKFLANQPKPSGVTPLAGGADLASNLIDAFTQRKLLQGEQAKEGTRSAELAKALGSQTVEGQVPPGQFGPGAPQQQPATLESIGAALSQSQDPQLQQLGLQQQLGQLGRQQTQKDVIGKETRAEQRQIRKEERAIGREGDLASKKLALEERKFDQSVRKFEAELSRGGLTPEKTFEQSQKLRKEFTGLSKEFIKQRDSFARLQASAQDPSAAGDLALIFNFMKILDPGSVVRESEFATAQNAPGIPDRVRAQYNRVLEGERFTPESRADFTTRGELLFSRAQGQQEQRIDQFFIFQVVM